MWDRTQSRVQRNVLPGLTGTKFFVHFLLENCCRPLYLLSAAFRSGGIIARNNTCREETRHPPDMSRSETRPAKVGGVALCIPELERCSVLRILFGADLLTPHFC